MGSLKPDGLVPFEGPLLTAFIASPVLLVTALSIFMYKFRRNGVAWGACGVFLALLVRAVFRICPLLVEGIMNKSNAPLHTEYKDFAANGSHGFIAAADLHSDALLWLRRDLLTESNVGHVDIQRLKKGHVRLQVFAMVIAVPRKMNLYSNPRPASLRDDMLFPKMLLERWPRSTWNSHLQRALLQCDRLHRLAAASDGLLVVTSSASQLRKAALNDLKSQDAGHVTHGILALEGASALEYDLQNVDRLFDAGLRVLGPAHFYDTEVGGAQGGVEKYGLTEFGHKALARIHELGMIVDLAHASDRLIEDVVAVSADKRTWTAAPVLHIMLYELFPDLTSGLF